MVIIEDFSYMHTIGQHKHLSLAREEGSNKIMYRIRFQGCWIRLVQAQIKPWVYKAEVWRHLPFALLLLECSPNGCRFLSGWGRFVKLGRCSHCGLCDFMWEQKYKLKNLWNPKCSKSIYILLFYNCLVFFRNPASTLFFFDTKQT